MMHGANGRVAHVGDDKTLRIPLAHRGERLLRRRVFGRIER
jgi:hypothetical protein